MGDLFKLIERLEGLFDSCRRVPLTGKLMVDEDEVYSIIDEIKDSVPKELQEAKWLNEERERIIADARSQADEIVKRAYELAERATAESAIAKQAESQAEELLRKARETAKEIRSGALEYAEKALDSSIRAIENSLASLKAGKDELRATK